MKAPPCQKCKAKAPPFDSYAIAQISMSNKLKWKCEKCGKQNTVTPDDVV